MELALKCISNVHKKTLQISEGFCVCGDGGNADASVSIMTDAMRHVMIEPRLSILYFERVSVSDLVFH